MILLEIHKEDTSPSCRSVRLPKPQIFVEMFRRYLQGLVWKRHVGAHLWCTNMAAGKKCKNLELTLAIEANGYLELTNKHLHKHFS